MVGHRTSPVVIFIGALLALCASLARAHEFKLDAVISGFVKIEPTQAHLVVRAPLYLFKAARFPVKDGQVDIDQSAAALERALAGLQQQIVLLEDGRPLTASRALARLALPSDRSFETFEQALNHVGAPVEAGTEIVVDQGYVDAHLTYPVTSPNAVFSLRTTVAPELGDYLKLTFRYLPQTGDSRAIVIKGGTGTVELNPTWLGAATGFVGLGVAHIVGGFDHLLFLMCLIIPLHGMRQLLTVVTGFTLAHSFTLIGSAFGLTPQGAWFPPFVEMVIALSIVYMAVENIIGIDVRRRVLLTMLFGLVHGFGFSYGLQEELQFAGPHLIVSLFAFNVGIEIGQILALAVMLPVLTLITRHILIGRVGAIVLSAILAHVGWHWMSERWEALSSVRWPTLDMSNLLLLLIWAGGLALAAGVVVATVKRLPLEPVPLPSAGRDTAAGPVSGE
jgi:HupE / UreJ protein